MENTHAGENSFNASPVEITELMAKLNAHGIQFWNDILAGCVHTLNKGYDLSSKQKDCVFKAGAQLAKKIGDKKAVESSIVEGRYELTVTVESIKDYETGGYSWSYETRKAFGTTDKGFKVWVSIPADLHDKVTVGSKVSMTATVSKARAGTFANATRPFNVTVL